MIYVTQKNYIKVLNDLNDFDLNVSRITTSLRPIVFSSSDYGSRGTTFERLYTNVRVGQVRQPDQREISRSLFMLVNFLFYFCYQPKIVFYRVAARD